jgi:hypothetical protein
MVITVLSKFRRGPARDNHGNYRAFPRRGSETMHFYNAFPRRESRGLPGLGKHGNYRAFPRRGWETTVITMLSCAGTPPEFGKHGNYRASPRRGWENVSKRGCESMVITVPSRTGAGKPR